METYDVESMVNKLIEAVWYANYVTLALQGKVTNIKKDEKSEKKQALTQADLASQEIILKPLFEYRSSINLIAEEDTILSNYFQSSNKKLSVIIDPIDGTWRYFNNDSSFGIQIGIVYDGVYVAAIVSLPSHSIVLSAIQGKGANIQTPKMREKLVISGSTNKVYCHDKVRTSEIEKIIDLGFSVDLKCGAEITTSPATGFAIAGIRPERVSLFGRIGALITLEANGYCCSNKGEEINLITTESISSLVVARDKQIAESFVKIFSAH